MFSTEVEFTLPKGYVDGDGVLHREGIMRLATAADEILPLKDPRVQQNPAYLSIIVLARVITRLGSLRDVNTKVVEGFYASDLNHLQRLYERLNADEDNELPAPEESAEGHEERSPGFRVVGGSVKAYPAAQLYEEMAFIAYHFHWSRKELMSLEHAERRRWCAEISHINRDLNGEPATPFDVA